MTSQPAVTTVLTRWRNWRDDHRGVAAVEFAIVLPFMLALYIGGVELGDGMMIQLKVTDTAHIVADLTSQQTASVTSATMTGILGASSATIAPYLKSNLVVTVSEVSTDQNSGAATVTWSQSLNGTKRPVGQAMTLPSSLAGQVAGLPAGHKDIALILGEVSYAYTPNLGYTITGTVQIADSYWLFPRNSSTISCGDC